MKIEADFWHLVGLLLGFLAFVGAAGALLLSLFQKHLDERFASQERARAEQQDQLNQRLLGLEQVTRDETLQVQRLERDFLQRFAELPHRFVMRDDYVRGQSVIEAKLDGLATKVENAQLRQFIKEGKQA